MMKTLRAHLVTLVLGAVLPLLVFSLAMMRQQLEEKREIIDHGMQATARALTLAVDGDVKASLGILRTLASSPLLDSGNLKSFHELCRRALEGRRGAYVILFDASGMPLVNSSRPFGAALPSPLQSAQPPGFDPRYPEVPMGGAEPVRKVIATGEPFISNLFVSLVTREPRIGLDVPVMREGEMRYVLELSLDAAEFSWLLAEQRSPESSTVAIVDRQGIAIASSVRTREIVGRVLAPDLAAQIANSASGAGMGRDADGAQVYHAFNASPLTGWKTSLSVTRSAAYAPISSAVAALATGAAIAILIALVAAIVLGRRVTRLVDRAPRASGASPSAPPGGG